MDAQGGWNLLVFSVEDESFSLSASSLTYFLQN